ncbi:MAG: glutamate--tRNA ligase [Candidatus Sumerlaeota bacterium]|nr:glutamate--tRNA ligase [Candidatus Sumerlaeota bacterium]
MAETIRVRFAPSPTGYLHVGGARTALFNWLFARRQGGRFVLRIEDTDEARSTDEAINQIIEGLRWLGLDWDEGPHFQSKRLDLYRAAADQILESGHAYRCFCTNERLETLREEAKAAKKLFVYDRKCASLDPAESGRRAAAGEPHVLRLRVPDEGVAAVEDLIRGTVKVDRSQLGDFVLTRTDGMPTFNFANVIDDHDMGITHVIRGEDHLPNTPRHLLLYRAFGYEPPRFAHVPMILGPDRAKLSKRHGAVSVLAYRDEGYLPEAMVNFLALLGWSLDDKTDFLTREQLIENFSIERINKAGAIFNLEKLQWLNGVHFRALGEAESTRRAREFMAAHGVNVEAYDHGWLDKIIALQIERSRNLAQLQQNLRYFLSDEFQHDEKAVAKHLRKEGAAPLLNEWIQLLSAAPALDHETLEPQLRALSERLQVSFSKLMQPCRVALTGVDASPGLFDVLDALGKERALKRLAYARDHLCKA